MLTTPLPLPHPLSPLHCSLQHTDVAEYLAELSGAAPPPSKARPGARPSTAAAAAAASATAGAAARPNRFALRRSAPLAIKKEAEEEARRQMAAKAAAARAEAKRKERAAEPKAPQGASKWLKSKQKKEAGAPPQGAQPRGAQPQSQPRRASDLFVPPALPVGAQRTTLPFSDSGSEVDSEVRPADSAARPSHFGARRDSARSSLLLSTEDSSDDGLLALAREAQSRPRSRSPSSSEASSSTGSVGGPHGPAVVLRGMSRCVRGAGTRGGHEAARAETNGGVEGSGVPVHARRHHAFIYRHCSSDEEINDYLRGVSATPAIRPSTRASAMGLSPPSSRRPKVCRARSSAWRLPVAFCAVFLSSIPFTANSPPTPPRSAKYSSHNGPNTGRTL